MLFFGLLREIILVWEIATMVFVFLMGLPRWLLSERLIHQGLSLAAQISLLWITWP